MSELFMDNKYARCYERLMDRARSRPAPLLSESHHVIPKALGGSDGECVALAFREHFIAHWLLPKFVIGEAARNKMLHALACMQRSSGHRVVSGWQYAVCRRAKRLAQVGSRHSEETLEKMSRTRTGRRHSEATRAKMSLAASGRKLDDATKTKIGAASRNRSEESLAKMAASLRGNRNAVGSVRSAENRAQISASLREFYGSSGE